jgi:hypothetical protein
MFTVCSVYVWIFGGLRFSKQYQTFSLLRCDTCSVVDGYQLSEEPVASIFSVEETPILNMEAAWSPEVLIPIHYTTRCHRYSLRQVSHYSFVHALG